MPKLLLSDIDNLIESDELELIAFACAIKDIAKLLDDIEDIKFNDDSIIDDVVKQLEGENEDNEENGDIDDLW